MELQQSFQVYQWLPPVLHHQETSWFALLIFGSYYNNPYYCWSKIGIIKALTLLRSGSLTWKEIFLWTWVGIRWGLIKERPRVVWAFAFSSDIKKKIKIQKHSLDSLKVLGSWTKIFSQDFRTIEKHCASWEDFYADIMVTSGITIKTEVAKACRF